MVGMKLARAAVSDNPCHYRASCAVELQGGHQGTEQVGWPQRKNPGTGGTKKNQYGPFHTTDSMPKAARMERGCGGFTYLMILLWPTGDPYRPNAELSLEQEQRLRNNLI